MFTVPHRASALLLAGLAVLTGCAPKPAPPAPVASTSAPSACDTLVFDLEAGTMNGVSPTVSIAEAERRLPCSTGSSAEGEVWNYGGGVFFLNHDFFVYTGQDWIEVRGRYGGAIVPADPRGAPPAAPGPFAQPHSEDGGSAYFTTAYGCLRLSFDPDSRAVDTVAVHARACEAAAQRE